MFYVFAIWAMHIFSLFYFLKRPQTHVSNVPLAKYLITGIIAWIVIDSTVIRYALKWSYVGIYTEVIVYCILFSVLDFLLLSTDISDIDPFDGIALVYRKLRKIYIVTIFLRIVLMFLFFVPLVFPIDDRYLDHKIEIKVLGKYYITSASYLNDEGRSESYTNIYKSRLFFKEEIASLPYGVSSIGSNNIVQTGDTVQITLDYKFYLYKRDDTLFVNVPRLNKSLKLY